MQPLQRRVSVRLHRAPGFPDTTESPPVPEASASNHHRPLPLTTLTPAGKTCASATACATNTSCLAPPKFLVRRLLGFSSRQAPPLSRMSSQLKRLCRDFRCTSSPTSLPSTMLPGCLLEPRCVHAGARCATLEVMARRALPGVKASLCYWDMYKRLRTADLR